MSCVAQQHTSLISKTLRAAASCIHLAKHQQSQDKNQHGESEKRESDRHLTELSISCGDANCYGTCAVRCALIRISVNTYQGNTEGKRDQFQRYSVSRSLKLCAMHVCFLFNLDLEIT